jgi:hypothetical protein
MAAAKVSVITIVYRGTTFPFETVTQAVRFLRRDDIRTHWLRKVRADVHLVSGDRGTETRHLKGQKYPVIRALEQLERELGG